MQTLNAKRLFAASLPMLLAACAANAGNGMTAAPVEADMRLDRVRAPVGATVKASLAVRPFADSPSLEFIIRSNGCAEQLAPAAPGLLKDVKSGKPIAVTASFTVKQAGQCMIIGEVLTINDGTTRLGSIFHVMLNPEPPAPDQGTLRTTPEGNKVIEYPSGKR